MGTDCELVNLASNLFRVYVIYRFAGVFYNREFINKKLELILYFIFYITTSGIYVIFNVPLLNIISNIVGLLIIVSIYNDTILKKILSVVLIYVINMVADSFIVFLLGQNVSNVHLSGVESIISTLIIFILELIVEKIVSTKNQFELLAKHGVFLIAIPTISIFMIAILVFNSTEKMMIISESTFILFINMVIFYLYDSIIKSYEEKYSKDLLERQLHSYDNQLKIIEKSQNNIKSLKHDIKHHLLQLMDMAKKNNVKEIVEYLNTMDEFIKNPDEYVNTGNNAIDIILNYMILEAKKITDNIKVKVCIPEDIKLDKFDMNIILGNLLKNSIEALEKCKNRELDIFIQYDKGVLYISIKNNYNGVIKKQNGKIITSKNDKKMHGIGLSNVEKIVEKYDGMLTIEEEKSYIIVDVLLYI
ncbi:sensor histidine kinase [Clostridium ihumii]|uniref:sensor histidine kinase n=1 Tax=Clostridium ihumii TaxID=1470356 RepID=UPI00058D43B3|nr:GHKL domain-containing protein [Clostridium ihumii]